MILPQCEGINSRSMGMRIFCISFANAAPGCWPRKYTYPPGTVSFDSSAAMALSTELLLVEAEWVAFPKWLLKG